MNTMLPSTWDTLDHVFRTSNSRRHRKVTSQPAAFKDMFSSNNLMQQIQLFHQHVCRLHDAQTDDLKLCEL